MLFRQVKQVFCKLDVVHFAQPPSVSALGETQALTHTSGLALSFVYQTPIGTVICFPYAAIQC